jgi:hypothetical protein
MQSFVVWKVIVGGVLLIPAVILILMYLNNPTNYFLTIAIVALLGPGAYLIYTGISKEHSGYTIMANGKKPTGNENCIVWYARTNPHTGRDVPYAHIVTHIEQKHIPPTARLKLVRNWNKHMYELTFNTETKKLEPTILPDTRPLTPQLYVLPAAMQAFKDWHDFSPASMLQKVAPGILIAAMIVIGILMVITGPQPG